MFARTRTAQLHCHMQRMQNLVTIITLESEWKQKKISIEFGWAPPSLTWRIFACTSQQRLLVAKRIICTTPFCGYAYNLHRVAFSWQQFYLIYLILSNLILSKIFFRNPINNRPIFVRKWLVRRQAITRTIGGQCYWHKHTCMSLGFDYFLKSKSVYQYIQCWMHEGIFLCVRMMFQKHRYLKSNDNRMTAQI